MSKPFGSPVRTGARKHLSLSTLAFVEQEALRPATQYQTDMILTLPA